MNKNTNINHEVISELHNTVANDNSHKLHMTKFEIEEVSGILEAGFDRDSHAAEIPNMWSRDYIGLYAQYAAVGLLYGSSGTLVPFCVYQFEGASNVCSNSRHIAYFAWNIKIFFALLTDSFRPFGMRRKPWMLFGWSMTLVMLFVLAVSVQYMSVSTWLVILLFSQVFVMFSDVPADGYCVELGQMEGKDQRGQIMATGLRVRFFFCVVAGVIQTFLLNGPSTNEEGCEISFSHCWSWGLTINQYYALLFVLVFFLTIPVWFLKELDGSKVPQHSLKGFVKEIWLTMQNLTTFYLLIFVVGTYSLSNFTNNANIYLQYYVIKLTSFEAGIDTITTYGALVTAIWIFQRFLINRNWRITRYAATIVACCFGLVWIAAYYDAGGTQNPWFTIFIDLDTAFAEGIAQVLYSMALIELASPGQEATTCELITTVANAASMVGGIFSTQLLTPMKAAACDDDNSCSSDTVDVTNQTTFNATDGPRRFTNYNLVLTSIMIVACLVFTPFLPRGKEECHAWKLTGEQMGTSLLRGRVTLAICIAVISYGVIAAILLLDVNTACQPAIGGSGC